MLETLTYTLVACGVLFLVLPVMIYVYAKMATLGYYAGKEQAQRVAVERLYKTLNTYADKCRQHKQPTEPGDN